MKKILGLDLGTTSIGWAFVNEAETESEKSSIQRLGVRVIPLTTDEENDFQKGKATSINADRTLKRGARRNLDRYQQRRDNLIDVLVNNKFLTKDTILSEEGKNTTFRTYQERAKAAEEEICKESFAKVLLMINKKRGYKSSRKVQSDEEGVIIDGMEVAKFIYEKQITPGQYVFQLLKNNKKHIPDFYRSDLENELAKIWETQKEFYPDMLTDEFKEAIKDKGKLATSKMFLRKYNVFTAENKGKRDGVKLRAYKWRSEAIDRKLSIEEIAYVIVEINNNINGSSGYLGAISDRSKELYFKKLTVGQYLYSQLESDPHSKLKNQVFYRQDYLDEFNTIWTKQSEFYPELTDELKSEIRDIIIFYQRRLKSQKHLISNCEFEKHHKTIPKSSPLFQEFKIWQELNNIEIKDLSTHEKFVLDETAKQFLFDELNIKDKLSSGEILKLLGKNKSAYELNYKEIDGNRTNAAFYKAYQNILRLDGEEHDFSKLHSSEINEIVSTKFLDVGINTELVFFDSSKKENELDKQLFFQLWHLVYSYEGDNSNTGIEKLIDKLQNKYGFAKEHAKLIANIELQPDYGSLSSRAIRKILPSLKLGNTYDIACNDAGYNHSNSLTKEERANRELKDKLHLLPKNSLRNPVVEKILNQMVNVINAIIDDNELGKPDEIRIELARELKKSAKERSEMTQGINKATAEHEKIRTLLRNDFGIKKVTRNDIIRYKLYEELKSNGYKTIYTGEYIPREELFSKNFDIEHIIPKAKLFDDSYSNKTLAVRQVNLDKSNDTAYDFLSDRLNLNDFEQYLKRIEKLLKSKAISKAKYNKLLMKNSQIPDGFIDRDLRNSQYIAKKAKQMLEDVVRKVNTTTGSITNRLRNDWQLVNVLKEITLPKYEKLDLVESIVGKNGQEEKQIKDWSKRNDHRHHAMDALAVAFTSHSHVQYLNNMSARGNEGHKNFHEVSGIENKYLYRDKNNKLLFKPPIPIHEFRKEAKEHLDKVLVSFKAKNKVVTRNQNKTKVKEKGQFRNKTELTPRGQLHKETVYGESQFYESKLEKIGPKFDLNKINQVARKLYREALLKRLNEFGGDPDIAFGGKNKLTKNPIYIDEENKLLLPEKVKLVLKNSRYTIRKDITHDLKIDKVVDIGIKRILNVRLKKFDGDAKLAFSNLEENPIWLNKKKNISIKRVTITGVSNAEALHFKKDHNGEFITDADGNKKDTDFVSTGNNHHVAIYRDEKENLKENVISFFEAAERARQGLPIINKSYNQELGWEFLFTLKQNEYFVFPGENFDPNEVDLLNCNITDLISPNLFRVQKISSKNYVFSHHSQTKSVDNMMLKNMKKLSGTTYHFIHTPVNLKQIVKVRINHLGEIVKIGEY